MGKDIEKKQIHTSCGAVVYRTGAEGVAVLAMHRTASDSWHLPKGTQELGETREQTAQREILEETGYAITLGPYLGMLESIIRRNGEIIPKKTHYFAATPTSERPEKIHDAEHDTISFVDIQTLKELLTTKRVEEYEKEYLMLETFLASGVLSEA